MNNFSFKRVGSGAYDVTYTTPVRGDYYHAIVHDMKLIDDTKGSENPTKEAIRLLKAS